MGVISCCANQVPDRTSALLGLAGFEAAHPLAQRLLEGAADGHHLAHRFHLRAEHGFRAREFLELPPRNLHHHVIDGRLEAGRRLARDVVLDLVEPVAHRQLGGDLGDREIRWPSTPAPSCATRADSSR